MDDGSGLVDEATRLDTGARPRVTRCYPHDPGSSPETGRVRQRRTVGETRRPDRERDQDMIELVDDGCVVVRAGAWPQPQRASQPTDHDQGTRPGTRSSGTRACAGAASPPSTPRLPDLFLLRLTTKPTVTQVAGPARRPAQSETRSPPRRSPSWRGWNPGSSTPASSTERRVVAPRPAFVSFPGGRPRRAPHHPEPLRRGHVRERPRGEGGAESDRSCSPPPSRTRVQRARPSRGVPLQSLLTLRRAAHRGRQTEPFERRVRSNGGRVPQVSGAASGSGGP